MNKCFIYVIFVDSFRQLINIFRHVNLDNIIYMPSALRSFLVEWILEVHLNISLKKCVNCSILEVGQNYVAYNKNVKKC